MDEINKKNLGQSSFLIKAIFVIIAVLLFAFIINYFASFRTNVLKQKEDSNFKISVLNTLQKLVSDEACLSYKDGNPQKPVLSKDKIDLFASTYTSTEPDCARPIDFDYSIRIEQLPYSFALYPGQKIVRGELGLSNEFSSHVQGVPSGSVLYFDCNFNPKEHPELCPQRTELDRCFCKDCTIDPKVNCPYEKINRICCVYYLCPKDACKSVEIKPGTGDCGSGCVVVKDCDLSKCTLENKADTGKCGSGYPHGACGMTYEEILIPTGEKTDVNVAGSVWEFGLSFGQTSFSPPKAKRGELQLSLPITIKYNESFSTEGVIYIYAVSGELEDIYNLLMDTCDKAQTATYEIQFTREFHFSYPVSYDPSNKNLCMGTSCKFFDCPYNLEFPNIEKEGNYILGFSFDSAAQKITVRK